MRKYEVMLILDPSLEDKDAKAARVSQWKWVESKRGSGLFDLSQDLGEKNDLSA